MKKHLLIWLIIHLTLFTLHAQDLHLIDSLNAQLKIQKQDSSAANILEKLCRAYWDSDPEKAIAYAEQCLKLSGQIDFRIGIGNAYHCLGTIFTEKADYTKAMDYHKRALSIRTDIGDKHGIAGSYNNIGQIYLELGNYSEALKLFFAALKMNEESNNKSWQSINLHNIGTVHLAQRNFQEAIKYSLACLKIEQEIGDKQGIAGSYSFIGSYYLFSQGNCPEALKNFNAALNIAKESGDKVLMAECYSGIALALLIQGNFPTALKSYFTGLGIHEEVGSKSGMAKALNGIGNCYIYMKQYKKASGYLNKSLSLSKQLGSLDNFTSLYSSLTHLDSVTGDYKKALEHYKLFIKYRDSLENTEVAKKTVALQMNYDFGKKQDSLNVVQIGKDAVAAVEIKRQKQQKYGLFLGFISMLGFAFIFLRQRNHIKKGKQKSDELLLNILPSEVAEELKETGTSKAKNFEEATVLFTDFKDFTIISEMMSPEQLVKEIDTCFSEFDNIISKYSVEKIKTIGDSYMCAGGLPVANKSHAEDVVKAAIAIRDFMIDYNKEKLAKGELPFEIRIGINTGPVVAGIVGVRKFAYDIWGDTVNIASRMESHGKTGEVNISGSTYELVKDKYQCVHRGKIQVKNKGEVDMYFVESSLE